MAIIKYRASEHIVCDRCMDPNPTKFHAQMNVMNSDTTITGYCDKCAKSDSPVHSSGYNPIPINTLTFVTMDEIISTMEINSMFAAEHAAIRLEDMLEARKKMNND